MEEVMNKLLGLFFVLGLSINAQVVLADNNKNINEQAVLEGNNSYIACPVGLVTGKTIDEEFGTGINDITRCLENREKIKMVMQVNNACRDTGVIVDGNTGGYKLDNHANRCKPGRGYGIAQMAKMIKDWVITHGIPAEKLDLNIIVHGGGGTMLLNNPNNKLLPEVNALLNGGVEGAKVKFHFCMNTVRGMVKKIQATQNPNMTIPGFVNMVIPGVTYVTGGLTALADFQEEGYIYIQP